MYVFRFLRVYYPEVFFLDISRLTILRKDMRYDELHLCIPGIADTWLKILFNSFIKIKKSMEIFTMLNQNKTIPNDMILELLS